MTTPVLAVTVGDVAGIGPEITAKALLHHDDLRQRCAPVVLGDVQVLRGPDEAVVVDDRQEVLELPRVHRPLRGS